MNLAVLRRKLWVGLVVAGAGVCLLSAPRTAVAQTPTLSTLTLSPTSIQNWSSTTATVTLTAAAPTGGATVYVYASKFYTSANPPALQLSLDVPRTVTVEAGNTSATFAARAMGDATASLQAAVVATCGSVTQSASLTITPGGTRPRAGRRRTTKP